MEVIICPDEQAVGRIAAERIARVLAQAKTPVLGVATGSTPLTTYSSLAVLAQEGKADFTGLRAFALDEYVGLPADDERSYAATIRHTVTEQLGLDPADVHTPDGMVDDLEAACADYEKAIQEADGVDVQILGIGANGHIGFNEPTSSLSSRTRVKTLEEGEKVPSHCVTQGLGTIMDARNVVLLAVGANKADALAGAVEGPVSAMCPASVLQFHPHGLVIADEAAASKLAMADYFRWTDGQRGDLPGAM